jgi:hypothetical protein
LLKKKEEKEEKRDGRKRIKDGRGGRERES